ncbi:hypothetical protein [Schnuerera sp.]|uniref:hypothetical protein n=1 Tax=Schnuerera sp. TaxID=2794844 RepID=UPI002D7E3DA9|nr:hypothetical protein [Schnuerera sp.]
MSSFSQDKKWMEAKKVIGDLDWIEIISYYRFIGGNNVFVYVAGDGDKKQIVDIIDKEGTVLLLNRAGYLETDTYDNVTNSKKIFEYSEYFEEEEHFFEDSKIKIPVKKRG